MPELHTLALDCHAMLLLEGSGEPMDISPDKFAAFDHYAETVVEHEEEVMKG